METPHDRVIIIVPFHHWGRLVQRAYLDKLIETSGEDNVRSLGIRFRIVTPQMAGRNGALRGYDNCLVLIHNEWSMGGNVDDLREVERALYMWKNTCPNVKVQSIGEGYYR